MGKNLEFSKAFDTVSHTTFLEKLAAHGCPWTGALFAGSRTGWMVGLRG